MNTEKTIIELRPSWWNFFWYLFFSWLIIPLIIAIFKRYSLVLRIYNDRVVMERGILSKQITQLLIADIRSVDTRQSFCQRLVNIGDILIATAGVSGYEIIAKGIPDPRHASNLILEIRQKPRDTT